MNGIFLFTRGIELSTAIGSLSEVLLNISLNYEAEKPEA
jgi:hypothetical protein